MFDTLRQVVSDHIKYAPQIWGLAKSELKKQYRGSTLGWAWAFANPIVRVCVYLFAFSVGLKQTRNIGDFSYFHWLLTGLIIWFMVQKVFPGGATCIKRYRFLVTKIKFPVSLIPTFTSLSQLIVHAIIVLVTMLIFIMSGHFPTIYWLQIPVYMLMLFMFSCSWGLFAGCIATMSMDFQQLVRSLSMAIFWLSGTFFTFDSMSIKAQIILCLNPVAIIVKGYRDCFIYGKWLWESPWIIEGILVYIVLTILALAVYKKLGKELPDVL